MLDRVLIVEDDLDLHFIICKMVMKAGYQVQSAYNGQDAKIMLEQGKFSLIILDLMLPQVSGEELIIHIRETNTVPILVTSSKEALEDRVNVLALGADDYLVKPFAQAELIARIQALLRRTQDFSIPKITLSELEVRDLKLNLNNREVTIENEKLQLTSKEFDLLHLLLSNPETVFTKEQLYQRIWGQGFLVEDNAINVHISNLRKKIRLHSESEYIETVWGIGFKLLTTA